MSIPDKVMKLKDGKILYDDLRNRVEYLNNDILDIGTIKSRNLNITPYDWYEGATVIQNMTFTANSDHSVTITGTPSGMYYGATSSEYRWLLPQGTYTLSGGLHSHINVSIFLFNAKDSGSSVTNYTSGMSPDGSAKIFTTDKDYWVVVRIFIHSGATLGDGITLYPQLECGTLRTTYQDPFYTTTGSQILNEVIHDVKINGQTISGNGIANILIASANDVGVAKFANDYGIGITAAGQTFISAASSTLIKNPTGGYKGYKPISAEKEHEAAFYGLAIAASDTTQSSSDNAVGTYTGNAKQKIQNMLGVTDLISTEESATATAAHAINSTFLMGGKLHRATAAIAIGDAVVVGTNCEIVKADEVFVKNTDIASNINYGLVKTNVNSGTDVINGTLTISAANVSPHIKLGNSSYRPITPLHQDAAVFYGLAKVAGADEKDSELPLGTYSDNAKTAIRSLIGAGTPLDVQINGTSIVSSGVANIPIMTASANGFGVARADTGFGTGMASNGAIVVVGATDQNLKAGTDAYRPIVPASQHKSIYYGLSKLAGVDLASETVTIGTYSTTSKIAIRNLIGATSSNVIAVQDEQPTDTDTKVWLPETESTGIEVPTYAEFQALDAAVVKKTDIASTSVAGIVKVNANYGTFMQDGTIGLSKALTDNIKGGTHQCKVIVPYNQHEAVFFGLSKAAGVDLASETVTVGTYPATASAAIRSMIGAGEPLDIQINGTSIVSNSIANIPLAGPYTIGVAKVSSTYGLDVGTTNQHVGFLRIYPPTTNQVKSGNGYYNPITIDHQHEAAFYGLAKAAGDTTMASSSNAVGTYTAEAKAAIHTMLGIDPASIAAQVDIPLVETVSGTTPTITGQPNVRYVCGEVSTISITPPASGSVDVIFESGSTATTMTVPSTVKWPAWFDAEALEANTTYEVLITDGVYGSVMTWAT